MLTSLVRRCRLRPCNIPRKGKLGLKALESVDPPHIVPPTEVQPAKSNSPVPKQIPRNRRKSSPQRPATNHRRQENVPLWRPEKIIASPAQRKPHIEASVVEPSMPKDKDSELFPIWHTSRDAPTVILVTIHQHMRPGPKRNFMAVIFAPSECAPSLHRRRISRPVSSRFLVRLVCVISSPRSSFLFAGKESLDKPQKRKKERVPTEEQEVRHTITIAAKTQDADLALKTYDRAIASGTIPSVLLNRKASRMALSCRWECSIRCCSCAGIRLGHESFKSLLYLISGGLAWSDSYQDLPVPWGHEAQKKAPGTDTETASTALKVALCPFPFQHMKQDSWALQSIPGH